MLRLKQGSVWIRRGFMTGILLAVGGGCLEKQYECSSNADCPAGYECVVYFPDGGGQHSSSVCMDRGPHVLDDGGPTDPGGPSDNGTHADPGVATDPGTPPDPGTPIDPGTTTDPGAATDPGTTTDPGTATDPGTESDPAQTEDPGGQDDPGAGEDPGPDAGTQSAAWYDSSNQRMWELGSSGSTKMTWAAAGQYCETLELEEMTDWRLPTISELRLLIKGCEATRTGGQCRVKDDCTNVADCWTPVCQGCEANKGPTSGCHWPSELGEDGCERYWSSSTASDAEAYVVGFKFAGVGAKKSRSEEHFVRCVRDHATR